MSFSPPKPRLTQNISAGLRFPVDAPLGASPASFWGGKDGLGLDLAWTGVAQLGCIGIARMVSAVSPIGRLAQAFMDAHPGVRRVANGELTSSEWGRQFAIVPTPLFATRHPHLFLSMTEVAAAPLSLLRHRSFVLFWCARTSTSGAYQMQAVAVGWQLYDLTNDPLDLGLVGLMQFFPVVALALVIGQTADHFDRRVIAGICQVVKAICAALFALGTIRGWLSRDAILLLILLSGTARAFEMPTLHSIVPGIVPRALLPRAIAASATAQQTAIICGPALGGFLYVLGPAVVYGLCTAIFITACILISFVEGRHRAAQKKPLSVETSFAGFAYIRNNPILLGAISLDLFAVLLGGVTALLPIYARDILGTGPWGLGLLRSAPAVGALSMSVFLARHAIERRAGVLMLGTVCIFGIASRFLRCRPRSRCRSQPSLFT